MTRAAKLGLAAATGLALVLAAALAARAIFWAPLNVDEELTRRVATEPLGSIFHIVSSERGGGPFHFWLIHFTLEWPKGLVGLRVPSLIFFIASLPAVALIGLELAGATAAAAAVLLTASAPLAISYSTFGRPHTLLLFWIEWGTLLGLRAARLGGRRRWIAAGAVLGSSVFVHPTAPLYAATAGLATLVYSARPLRALVREAWPGALAFVIALVPYYLKTLHVLSDRYGVGSGAPHGRTFTGNPVWVDALHVVAPGPHDLNWLSVFALVGFAVLVVTRRFRVAGVLALTVVMPVLFFTYVPANGLSALFFDRYMLPALPAFMILVGVAIATVANWAGGARLLVFGILVAGLAAFDARIVLTRQNQLKHLDLNQITAAVRADSAGSVLFSTTGSQDTTGYLGAFNFGRPANLLDQYLKLRIPSIPLVDDDTCVPVVSYLASPSAPEHGIWIFYAARTDEETAASAAFAAAPGVTVAEPAPHYFLVRSKAALPPRQLVTLALALRRDWQRAVPMNPRVIDLVNADSQALNEPAACKPHGFLDDPDISPNWPEALT
ncbi:MAG TPA: glycosyltransferase family 39 protein [Gaiellaceae bacterium]|nr:glycosyltransferase family 39 protein [Gaiellaceae bacterium]